MYLKIFLNFILIVILVILQFSFVSAMPMIYSGVNILLVAIVFVLALFGVPISLWWVIGIGGFYDTISFSPFGFFLVTYLLVLLIVNFLQKNFFTNRSLYSFFALITFATFVYKIVLYGLTSLFSIWGEKSDINLFYDKFWMSELYSLFLNIILVFIVYNVINFMSKKLKPTFLIKR